jgi:hypothetical protein
MFSGDGPHKYERNTKMAASETKTDKRKGPRGPRQAKPIFCVVSATNADGSALNLNAQSGITVNVRMTKDSAELVGILTGGGASDVAVVQAQVPAEAERANPGEAAA